MPEPDPLDRPCKHEDFEVLAEVSRITRDANPGAEPVAYSVSLRVWCVNPVCREPFRWIGVPAGALADRPACSPDETELRAPIRPASSDPDFGLGIPGFAVRYHEGMTE